MQLDHSAYEFIHDLMERRDKRGDSRMLALLQPFVTALFTLFPPDLDSLLLADHGTITGLIDWDGVYVGPRQSVV